MRTALVILALLGLSLISIGAAAASSSYFSRKSWLSLFSGVVADDGADVERDIRYGPHSRQTLDIYRPHEDRGGPIVIYFYGGSWRFGEKETHGFVGAALASRGITTVIPNYRLYPEVRFPAFVRDGAVAYRWVADHLAKGTSGTRRIVLFGHSAGAHIAAMLAVEPHYLAEAGGDLPAPAGLISLAGPLSFDPTTWESTKDIFAPAAPAPDTARPARLVRPGAPPSLLMHGTDDDIVRVYNSRDFAKALKAAGVDVRELEFGNVEHIGILLAMSRPFRGRAPVLEEIVRFVRDVAKPRPTRQRQRATEER